MGENGKMGTLNTIKAANCDTAMGLKQSDRGKARACLIAILVIQVIAMVFWGSVKQGFHHDEILTFQISNDLRNTDYLAVNWRDDFYDTWHNGAYYSETLVAQEDHLFDYHGVYQKMTHDIALVFYYYGIHTLCSLFPNVFSKWLGIVPNILYFVLTQIALYAIGSRLSKSRFFGLLTVVA